MKTIHMHRTVRILVATAPVLLAGALAAAGPAAAASAEAAAAPAAASFPHFDHRLHADSFWAGYADTGTAKFTSISGSWTVPKLNCAAAENSSVSPWLGLDGWSSDTVEQIGFDQDCESGVASYHPWVEMYPANSIYFTETVKAGDEVTASVSVSGTTFTLVESDTTQSWTKTYTKTGDDQLSSAEAIVEDLGNGIGPVADFGTIPFVDLTSNGKPLATAGTPNSTNLERGSIPLTKNSPLNGGDYTITWLHA